MFVAEDFLSRRACHHRTLRAVHLRLLLQLRPPCPVRRYRLKTVPQRGAPAPATVQRLRLFPCQDTADDLPLPVQRFLRVAGRREPRSRPQCRRVTHPRRLLRIPAQPLQPVQGKILPVLFILEPSRIVKHLILRELPVQVVPLLPVQLTELHRYLLAVQNSPVPGKSALKAVQLRLDQNSSDPIFATRQMAKTLPAPLNRWMGKLADQAWHVVMVEAVHYMEMDWRDNVVKPFNEQLADKYPFNPRASQDASLDAFERFFKPDGTLDTFYKENLRLFLENDLTFGEDGRILIREDIQQQIETAQKIRDIFFSQQNGLGAQFAVETVSLSGNKRRSVLNLDGQLVDYSQGRNYTAHLVWPNNMREGNESKLTLVSSTGSKSPRSITFIGPWAQFRLFGAGQLTNVTSDTFTVRFNVDGGYMIYRVHVDTEDNPFTGGLFSQFRLPDTLY